MTRLLRTATFRLSLLHVVLTALSAAVVLGFVHFATVGLLDAQTDAVIDAELQGLEAVYAARGLPGLARTVSERSAAEAARLRDFQLGAAAPASVRRGGMVYLLAGAGLQPLAGNIDAWPREESESVRRDGRFLIFYLRLPGDGGAAEERRVRAMPVTLPEGLLLLVGRETAERAAVTRLIERSLALGLGLAVLLGVAGGALLSRNALRRLESVNRLAREIVDGGEPALDRRLPVRAGGADDEYDRLTANLNGMLDRISRLMAGMRAVTEDVAHDLRAPLTRLRTRIDVALLDDGADAAALRTVLDETAAEIEEMTRVFDALLSIARLESGAATIDRTPVAVAALLEDAADLYRPILEDVGVALTVSSALPEGASLPGDRALLLQALANLLDNAAKYGTPRPGVPPTAVLSAAPVAEGVELRLRDPGPGIAPEDRARALERHVRLDPSRSTPGNGLGLASVAAVARVHGGRVAIDDGGVALVLPAV